MTEKANNQMVLSDEEIRDLAIKYSPYPQLREVQEKAVIDIINAYQNGEKLVELPAPTASGKTLILTIVGKILANEFGHDLVLTTTPLVALADQYSKNKNYADIPCLIGKKNYPCARYPEITADDCPITVRKDKTTGDIKLPPSCSACAYRLAKERFDNSPIGYTTFDRYHYDPNIKGRVNILLIDESASIEKKLRGYAELEIDMSCDNQNLTDWLEENYNKLLEEKDRWEEAQEENFREFEKAALEERRIILNTMKLIKTRLARLNKEIYATGKALRYIEMKVPYILTVDEVEKWNKERRAYDKVKVKHFKLITAEKPFVEMIKTLDFVVLASGTPATQMLTKEPYKIISVEHPIPVEVRPAVFIKAIGSMSYKTRDATAVKEAEYIAQLFKDEKHNVMVHCGSYVVAQIIYNNLVKLVKREDIILQTKKTRRESLDKFLNANHMIYLSVEMQEGVDLNGPKFKVNVIAKLPCPLWTDPYTIARNAYDTAKEGWNRWYDTNSSCAIMQAYGRTSRTPEDESVTYILDSAILSFWKRYNTLGNHKIQLFYSWFDQAAAVIT